MLLIAGQLDASRRVTEMGVTDAVGRGSVEKMESAPSEAHFACAVAPGVLQLPFPLQRRTVYLGNHGFRRSGKLRDNVCYQRSPRSLSCLDN